MMEMLCGLRFFRKKSKFLFFNKKVVAAIYRLISNTNLRHVAERFCSAFDPSVRSVH